MAPPKSTAKRSSEIVPSRMGWPRTKRKPSSASWNVGRLGAGVGSALTGPRPARPRRAHPPVDGSPRRAPRCARSRGAAPRRTSSTTTITNGSLTPAAYRKPAATGPSDERGLRGDRRRVPRATGAAPAARCRRAATATRAWRTRGRCRTPPRARRSARPTSGQFRRTRRSPRRTPPRRPRRCRATLRRSNRSAIGPLTKTSSSDGRNSARPSRPRLSSLPVRSNTNLPSAIVSADVAIEWQNTDTSSATTERRNRGAIGAIDERVRRTVGCAAVHVVHRADPNSARSACCSSIRSRTPSRAQLASQVRHRPGTGWTTR